MNNEWIFIAMFFTGLGWFLGVLGGQSIGKKEADAAARRKTCEECNGKGWNDV